MPSPQVVLLDVGGVLLVPDYRTVGPLLRGFGVTVTAATAERAHYLGMAAIDREPPEPGVGYFEAYATAAGVSAGHMPVAIEAMRLLWAGPSIELWQQVVKGSVEGLHALAEAGCRLGVISNSDGTAEGQLLAQELCQLGPGVGIEVEVIVDSHLVGHRKPDPEIFRHVLDVMAICPEAAVYVGDSVRMDVLGAQSAGLHALHFDPHGICDDLGHAHVASLAQVADGLPGPARDLCR